MVDYRKYDVNVTVIIHHKGGYPRVTSFDAIRQSTDICAHRITFSSRKFIILNKYAAIIILTDIGC